MVSIPFMFQTKNGDGLADDKVTPKNVPLVLDIARICTRPYDKFMRYLIYSIEGNRQRLDGGAMFGNAPQAVWKKWAPPDERNRIELACRCFLIHDTKRDRRILLETGIGVFFEPKLRDRFGIQSSEHRLIQNLARLNIAPRQIDVVVLSHLHFDHSGGMLTAWQEGLEPELLFTNAQVLTSSRHWERAKKSHLRDHASFNPRLNTLLEQSGRLELVDGEHSGTLGDDFRFFISDGHTPGLLVTELSTGEGAVAFCSDLIPGLPWIHLPITMGYDRYPELLIDEKQRFLCGCLDRGTLLLLTHDPNTAVCTVIKDERGRYRPDKQYSSVEDLSL